MPHKDDCQRVACRYRRGEGKGQAPRLSMRIEPEALTWIQKHGGGVAARNAIEAMVQRIEANIAVLEATPGVRHNDDPDYVLPELLALKYQVSLEALAAQSIPSTARTMRVDRVPRLEGNGRNYYHEPTVRDLVACGRLNRDINWIQALLKEFST